MRRGLLIAVLLLLLILLIGALSVWRHLGRIAERAKAVKPDENPFKDSGDYTGPPLTEEMVRAAEAKLGYKLPQSYVCLLRIRNGGSLRRSCFPMGEHRFQISGIFGVGGQWGIDTGMGSRHLIREWGYPDVGIVVGLTPSAGHDIIMLDYSACGPQGEPRVIHVETESADAPEVLVLAPDFETFLRGLVESDEWK